jgi:hypothetical protein
MPTERGHSVHVSTSTPLCLGHRGACESWSLLCAGDQCGNAVGYGGPQRSGQVVTHAVDHDQLRSWNRFCGRLPAAYGNDRVRSAVSDKGAAGPAGACLRFGRSGVAMAAASWRATPCGLNARSKARAARSRSSVSSVGYAGEPAVWLKSIARSWRPPPGDHRG